jgi:hypothetical protein
MSCCQTAFCVSSPILQRIAHDSSPVTRRATTCNGLTGEWAVNDLWMTCEWVVMNNQLFSQCSLSEMIWDSAAVTDDDKCGLRCHDFLHSYNTEWDQICLSLAWNHWNKDLSCVKHLKNHLQEHRKQRSTKTGRHCTRCTSSRCWRRTLIRFLCEGQHGTLTGFQAQLIRHVSFSYFRIHS